MRRTLKTTPIKSQDELVDWFDTHFPALKETRAEKLKRDRRLAKHKQERE